MNQALSAQVLTGKHQHECRPSIMIVTNQDRQRIVTLSAAKGLAQWAHRGSAEFTLSEANGLSMTAPILVVNLHYRGASGAKKLACRMQQICNVFYK